MEMQSFAALRVLIERRSGEKSQVYIAVELSKQTCVAVYVRILNMKHAGCVEWLLSQTTSITDLQLVKQSRGRGSSDPL